MIPYSIKVSPLIVVVLLHHVVHCEDAENDADRTVQELVRELNEYKSHLTKGVLESALYCCNLENERGNFWHPLGHSFDAFLADFLSGFHFDRYYNVIVDKKYGKKKKIKTD